MRALALIKLSMQVLGAEPVNFWTLLLHLRAYGSVPESGLVGPIVLLHAVLALPR